MGQFRHKLGCPSSELHTNKNQTNSMGKTNTKISSLSYYKNIENDNKNIKNILIKHESNGFLLGWLGGLGWCGWCLLGQLESSPLPNPFLSGC